jgi:hypothetical protein
MLTILGGELAAPATGRRHNRLHSDDPNRCPFTAMNKLLGWIAVLAAPFGPGPAQANDAALQRCRAVAESAARLACYDALPIPGPAPGVAPVAAANAGANTVATTQIHAAAPGATTLSTTTLRAAPVAANEAGFGLEQKRDEQLKVIVSRILGPVEGWGPRTKFRLENGQLWQVSDDSTAVYNLQSPKVKIERAVLGGFEMELEGAKRAPRVKRLE